MNDTVLDVLRWVGIVLAGGFVGYFGRYLAMLLIERWRRRGGAPAEPRGAPPPLDPAAAAAAKAAKKRAKAEVKRAKKAGRG